MRLAPLLAGVCLSAIVAAQSADTTWVAPYQPIAQRLISASTSTDFAWQRLAELTDTFGSRLAGSDRLEMAIDWAVEKMKQDGLENVHKEPVRVPKWVRGRESLDLVQPVREPLVLLGLGGSVPTPPSGIEADVLVVGSYDELDRRAADATGRIVLYNVPFTDYSATVTYRSSGASRAAKAGAVAVLLRSVGPAGLRTPHTGSLKYETGVARIPAAAIPSEDADRFQRLQDRRVPIRMRLVLESHTEPDAQSYNVVGEVRGRERPDEIVVVGGHIDSWDVGAGAVDDGGGCVVTWEALRLMKTLQLRPRRTVRVVLFTNEENGARGGSAYAAAHAPELKDHVAMLESDIGVFNTIGFGFTYDPAATGKPGRDVAKTNLATMLQLLRPLRADRILGEAGGTDIQPAARAGNIPMLALNETPKLDSPDYFRVHHTPADTVARLTPKQVADNAAAVAVVAYVIADLPFRLGEQ